VVRPESGQRNRRWHQLSGTAEGSDLLWQTSGPDPLRDHSPMASHVEAIIFDGDPQTAALPDGLKTVLLTAGLTMLPLTHEALEQLGAEDWIDT